MLFGILKLLWMAKKQKEIVMTNNLLNLKKDLKSFAKKCKDFKYTDSALLTFLLNGMLQKLWQTHRLIIKLVRLTPQ